MSPKALGRVDLDRTRLSAEVYTNFLPSTQGAMSIRPGTKYFGSSLNDTGAYFIEFIAAIDDVALLELTHEKMRIWMGADSHNLSLLERPPVSTTLSLSDTGWEDVSTGGVIATSLVNLIPKMTAATTNGVTVSASHQVVGNEAWKACDRDIDTEWLSGDDNPEWIKIDFGAGNSHKVKYYAITSGETSGQAPAKFYLQSNDVDTGNGWTNEDYREIYSDAYADHQRKVFTDTGYSDTGANERRYWRLYVDDVYSGYSWVRIAEFELFDAAQAQQVTLSSGTLTLNATATGSLAKASKRVVVDTGDYGVEHSIHIDVERGPVTVRIGSTQYDDDYVREASLDDGHHCLSFYPTANFYIVIQADGYLDRIVNSVSIGDTGTVEITTPWQSNDLNYIRYDQSADVVYVDCDAVHPYKIERRGIGRSWSVVKNKSEGGPFLPYASSSAKLSVSNRFGNTTLNSDIPFFTSDHVGGLVRIRHDGQGGKWHLGALDAMTDAVQVTGISDTGAETNTSERTITIASDGSGAYVGTITIERSFDGPDIGFRPISTNLGAPTDTGSFSRVITDQDDNLKVWYRARMTSYTSGAAVVNITYKGGATTGIGRITNYNSNTDVDIEVLRRFSDTGPSDNWQEGYWSAAQAYPSSVALHGGRLCHASGGNIFMSVSDDYNNHDDGVEGDAAPLIKTLGSGPVNSIHYLISLLRLIVGTSGAELSVRSSSLDEPITPSTANIRVFSTQGSASLRAIPLDTKAIFVQRSGQRVFMAGFGVEGESLGDYQSQELTLLVPDLLKAGVVSIAIQRQPDTRVHCVLSDGKVGLMTYHPQEQVLCWTMWETDGYVEKVAVLPGSEEDAVYYHVRRTINGVTKRYIEKLAMQSECNGDTGLSWIADCAKSFTDTGRASTLTGFSHLAGKATIVWADDTGQATAGKDLSPDVNGIQTTYVVDTGAGTVTLSEAVHHAVVGLPYTADWKSAKLSFGAEAGTALGQIKRIAQMALVLYNTHNNGLLFGSDTGNLDSLPRVIRGATVDADAIHDTIDAMAIPFPGTHGTDERLCLRAKAPRPVTVIAAIPSVGTNERV